MFPAACWRRTPEDRLASAKAAITRLLEHIRGDLLVQVVVEIPKKLSHHQEELLREFAKTERKGVLPQREGFVEKLANYLRQDEAEDKKKP